LVAGSEYDGGGGRRGGDIVVSGVVVFYLASGSDRVPDLAMTDLDAAISLERIGVRYRLPKEHFPSFKEFAIQRMLRGRMEYHNFFALEDVSLDVRRGEVLGIVGANGAGKSTLLKVIARVLPPTEGRVRVWGRVAPLLELGAGFDPELTGRENVFLNGALLGRSRAEMESRLEAILDFAGVREFIDAPLYTFSSGMMARLGFAIATDVEPDILIVDEILSVGDADFQEKSQERIQQFCQRGITIVIVSHNLQAIQALCSRAAWLKHGNVQRVGEAASVVNQYWADRQ
jgi:ABC-2 type transport system ATP-binding protein/lipopolysaccharide transport system ATP-binding protein